MLIWKSRCGYCSEVPNENRNLDLSILVYTDDNNLFTVNQISKNVAAFNRLSNNDFNRYIEQNWGLGEISNFRNLPSYHSMSLDVWLDYFPTLFQTCPNLNKYMYDNSRKYICPFVHIPSLNRIIICRSYHAAGVGCILYDNDGNRKNPVYGITDGIYGYTYNFGSQIFYDGEYQGKETLSNKCYGDTLAYGTNPLNFDSVIKDNTRTKAFFKALFEDATDPDYIPDPYNPIDPSSPGGGDGTFDDESDLIPVPPLPTLSASNTGFTRIYNPTLAQVQDLARYLWTEPTVIETIWNKIKTFFENPMDAIIGFNLVPVPVPSSGVETLKIIFIDTGVSMNVASNQFVDVDCGTLELKEYYGSALDYSPNTKIMVYLPYIGTVTVDTDEVMGRTLQVKYRVDICSGSCVAYILVDGNAIYQYSGHCAITIPFSAADFTSYVNAAISVAKLAGAAVMGGAGIGATESVIEATQKTSDTDYTYSSRGKQKPVSGHETVETTSSTKTSYSGIGPANIVNTVGQVVSAKPHIEHSGSFSGNSGYLGVRRPFVIIKRPNLCMPSDYAHYNGYPSMITLPLSECSGYTRVQQLVMEGFTGTNPEQAELMELLKGGVYF